MTAPAYKLPTFDANGVKIGAVGPQIDFIRCPLEDVFYGGARGGMKTYGCVLDFMTHESQYGKDARGIIFRRTYDELEEVERICQELLGGAGWRFRAQKRTWESPRGASFKLRYLKRDEDAQHYQGHQYCVAVETPVLMADRSWKPIETVRVGDYVATLEGPRRVLNRVTPYLAPCVRANLSYGGVFVASQIHPVWHPIYGVEGWRAWSEGGRTADRASWDGRRGEPPPRASFDQVVLHEPGLRLTLARGDCVGAARQSHSPYRSTQWWSGSRRARPSGLRRRPQLGEHVLSWLGHDGPWSPNALACARRETRGDEGSLVGCPNDTGFGGVHAHVALETDREAPPSQADAEGQYPEWREGGWEPTATHIRLAPGYWEHPYTGEARRLSESVVVGEVVMEPCGRALVADLTVEGVNHYITEGGLVNKNTRIYGDEAGNFANPRPFDLMYGALRSPQGVPCGRRLTGNPGGPGHGWLKARYVSPSKPWIPFKYRPQPDELPNLWVDAVFIPSTLDDNPFLMRNDPKYEQRLAMVGGPELFRAWRYGDWDITAGAALEIVKSVHIVRPFKVPDHWLMFAGFDWGFAHPWSFSIYAVNEDGRIFCIDTLRGRRLRDPEIVKDIKYRYPAWERIDHVVADPACWNKKPESKDDTPNTAEIFQERGLEMVKGNHDRIPGLKNFREYLAFKGRAEDGSDDDPRFCWMDTKGNRRAVDAIQSIVTDPDNPEDALKIDYSEGGAIGDDDYDQTRYALASRPVTAASTWLEQPLDAWAPEVLEHEALEKRRVKRHRPQVRQPLPEAVT